MKVQHTVNYDAQLPEVQPVIITNMVANELSPEPTWLYRLKLAGLFFLLWLCLFGAIWFLQWGSR